MSMSNMSICISRSRIKRMLYSMSNILGLYQLWLCREVVEVPGQILMAVAGIVVLEILGQQVLVVVNNRGGTVTSTSPDYSSSLSWLSTNRSLFSNENLAGYQIILFNRPNKSRHVSWTNKAPIGAPWRDLGPIGNMISRIFMISDFEKYLFEYWWTGRGTKICI